MQGATARSDVLRPAPDASIRARLSAESGRMAPAQQRLAHYLLEHVSTAPDLTITDLAEEAEVSVGTISQLCRRLGLAGYQDLRLGLAREAVSMTAFRAAVGADGETTLPKGPFETTIDSVFGAGIEALSETAKQLSRDAIASAVSTIMDARRVEWVGVGSAGLVAAEGALKLRKLGVDCVAHFDGHQQVMSAALLDRRDAAVAVSHSGRTSDVLESVRVAHDGGAKVIAITGVAASPLARQADIVLATVSYDTAFQVEPMASTLAQLAVVQLLFLSLLDAVGTTAEDRLARTQQALENRHVGGRL